jgi:hypothetical protein
MRLSVSLGVPPPKRCGSPFLGQKTSCISLARIGVVT